MSSGQPSAPAQRDPARDYQSGIDVFLNNLPRMLNAEEEARMAYDPARISEQQALQRYFGPEQYREQLSALQQLDPESMAIRRQLATNIYGDLRSGYNLPAGYDKQLTQQVRGAQSARGNTLGQSAGNAEAAFKGKAAIDLYRQNQTAAGNFLSTTTPIQQISQIQGVSPDRSMAYTNPSAGYQGQQYGLQNYSNQLAGYQLAGGGRNPWAGAAAGAASGAAAGSAAGGWGSLVGGIVGAGAGYFCDARIKGDVTYVGASRSGVPLVEFSYKSNPNKRYRGALAQDVIKRFPQAVKRHAYGLLTVDFGLTDVTFSEA